MNIEIHQIDIAKIELQARAMRAEAARNGFVAFRKAIANAFATLGQSNSKTA